MKPARSLNYQLAIAAAILTVSAAALSLTQTPALSVDEIVQKNIAAHGGADKMRAIKSLKMTGKLHAEGVELPLTIQIKRPGMARGDATLQGQRFVLGYDGQTAWEINAFDGKTEPERLAADNNDARDIIEMAELDGLLLDYKAKGTKVDLAGNDEVESTPVYKLKVELKNGHLKYVFLDAKSFLELKVSSRRTDDSGEHAEDDYFSDYKAVNGVLLPFSMETRVDGKVDNQIIIEKIEPNVEIDDSIFKFPKKAEK